jgi:hypothetical protein
MNTSDAAATFTGAALLAGGEMTAVRAARDTRPLEVP